MPVRRPQRRTTIPCLLACRYRACAAISLSSLEHSLPDSSDDPHNLPPQSSLTRVPSRLMPYRSHEQTEVALDGEDEPLDRELADLEPSERREGTLPEPSLSELLPSSDEERLESFCAA